LKLSLGFHVRPRQPPTRWPTCGPRRKEWATRWAFDRAARRATSSPGAAAIATEPSAQPPSF